MKILKRIILCFVLAFCLALNCFALLKADAVTVVANEDISDIDEPIIETGSAAVIGEVLEMKAKSAILIETNTGQILYDMNSDEELPPASVTKVMSLYLIMKAIDEKRFSVEDVITVSDNAVGMGGSQIWLKQNESMTVDDLLKAAVIASANDATVALAEKVSGSEEGFVALMNKTAKDMGLSCTFKNCTGLDEDGHLMSARDIAVLGAELIKYPLIKKYSTVWMESLRGGQTELVNTNKLIRFYDGATGLKTGTTSKAGCCLCATAERDGLSLCAVVLGAENSKERFAAAQKMLNYGFSNYSFKSIDTKKDEVGEIKIKGGKKTTVKTNDIPSIPLLLQKSGEQNTTKKININKNIKAPVKSGDKLGRVEILLSGETVGAADITAGESVGKKTVLSSFLKLIENLFVL